MPIKKRKLYCDEYRKTCSDPEVERGKDACGNGHTAKELEKHRREIDGFKKISDQQDKNPEIPPPAHPPRTLHKIYDDVIEEHSKP